MADYMSYDAQSPSQPPGWALPAAAGAGAGIAGYSGYQAVKSAKKMGTAGVVLGAANTAMALSVGSQASTVQSNAQQIASAANALTFTAGGATGAEVGALRAQFVSLASQVTNLSFALQPSNALTGATQPVAPVPSASYSAGTAVTQTSTSNNSGLLALGLIFLGYSALKD